MNNILEFINTHKEKKGAPVIKCDNEKDWTELLSIYNPRGMVNAFMDYNGDPVALNLEDGRYSRAGYYVENRYQIVNYSDLIGTYNIY